MQDLNDLFFFAAVVANGGFAPAGRWEELSVFTDSDQRGSEVSS